MGSSGLMISFSTLVGSASNLQDFEGIDIMIFSNLIFCECSEGIKGLAGILLRRLKFRMNIYFFFILFIKKVAKSSANSSLLVEQTGDWVFHCLSSC